MLWLVLLSTVLLPTYLLRFTIAGIPTTFLEILIYVQVIWLFICQPISLTLERIKPILRRYGWPIGLFLLSGIISALIAPDLREAFGLLKAYVIDPILLFGVMVLGLEVRDDKNRTLWLNASIVTLAIITSLSTFFINDQTADGRALGIYVLDPTSSPNFVALLLAPLAAYCFALCLLSLQRRERTWAGIGWLITLAALFASGSRGGALAAGVGCGLVLLDWLRRRYRKLVQPIYRYILPLFIVGAVALGIISSLPNFGSDASARAATSNNLRYEIWRTTIVDIIPHKFLLGTGLGNYQNYFGQITQDRINYKEFITPWARTPHNILLTLWVNLGLLGVASFIWLLLLLFDNLIGIKESSIAIRTAIAVAVVTLLVHGLVDAAYWKNDLAALFWIFLALSQLYGDQHVQEQNNFTGLRHVSRFFK